MKKIMFILLVLISVPVLAQQGQKKGNQSRMSTEEQVAMKIERLNNQLELTEAQQAQLKELFTEQAESQKAMMTARRTAKDRPSREEMTKVRETRRQAMEEKMQKVLTAEQYSQWQEMASTRRDRKMRN